ncbi:LRR receptor-like serine/threonine-protein kinase IOS1 [Benincasa hispida]|uniref:LRR receptor-like serine/threonine-protein kinase IOS1 n=1 Tax=Benincasa hispida TaxID=102211 RepID=UPI001900FE6E|nr:LRR receptor-like serine/threonine-protein kinase IOS1 [Benincasa hispida]
MDVSTYLLFAFLSGLALVNLVQAQGQLGFISLDCGLPPNTNYIEPTTTLQFTSDAAYIKSGVSKSLSSNYNQFLYKQYHHVRSFPQGRRNCYDISVKKGTKYLMRASFFYGNYDGLSQLPKFNLYLGDSLWKMVNFTDENMDTTVDSIHVTLDNQVQICLVNTNTGTPFISSLEFRPLPNETYKVLTRSLLLSYRLDMGTTTNLTYRFPNDTYDRFWVPYNWGEWTSISSALTIDPNTYEPGSIVMETAAIRIDTKKPLEIWWETEDENTQYYVYMHFAEVEKLQPNQTRGFNITYNGSVWYGPLIPDYLSTTTIFSQGPLPTPKKKHLFSLIPIENSTHPPIINAMEIYSAIDLLELTSDQGDVGAITSIKSTYGIVRDWEGDPCVPRAYPWEGIACTKTNGTVPRIVSLNLSSSGLAGEISQSIENLQMLQILDLSNNDLTGNIPDFLSNLSNLEVLKLDNNKLTGSVPSELLKRHDNGSLSLSVQGNPNLDCTSDSCKSSSKKKTSVVIPIVASIGGLILIIVVSIIILWIVKSRKKRRNETVVPKVDPSGTNDQISDHLLETRRRQFTYSEVLRMTNNFERILGKGGFGMVYYGTIDDTQVAVKMLSQASGQGYQQFQAEVTLLLRVHHKNLTNLVGYLNEGDRLGLIYEFMAKGNLAEHLSETSSYVLSWQDRLRIAMDAAQGLEYLHDGCKPPIIHRDVKTTNILLTENFQAKLADFGLSKSFPVDGNKTNNYMSTIVAGTPGYLDPDYYLSNRLTEKSDVYSFGVALLEIISCRPVISRSEENVHISKWVNSMVAQGDINGIVDERLGGKYDANSVWKAVEVALSCVSGNSARRPTMNQVVAELKSCLAMELERTPESRGFDSTNSVNMMSIVMDYSEAAPMAR